MAYGYNPDDYQLKISAITEGGKEVTTLADQIEALGKDAGTAQEEFQQLATALRNTGQSQDALNTFKAVKQEAQRLRLELDGAAAAVDRYDAELNQSRTATRAVAQAQADAAAKLDQSRQGYDQIKLSLQSARNEVKFFRDRIKETGDSTGLYAQQLAAAQAKVADLGAAQKSARAEVKALAGDHKAAALEIRAAEKAERELERQYQQSIGAAKKLSAALQEENTRLDAARAVLNAAGIETTKLSTAQAKLAGDMQKTAQAAQALADKQRITQQASQAVAQSMSAAWGAVGVRSAAAIQAEITRVNQALTTLASNTRVSGAEFTRAYAAGQAKIATLKAELEGAGRATNALGDGFKKQGDGIVAALGPATRALAALAGAQQFLQSNIAFESLERSMIQLKGSAEAAEEEIDWLRQTANRLGLEVDSVSRAYINLAAASRGTALEGKATRDIFEAVSGAMSKLGRSSADTEGALQAISQMMSKGVVSMEEWRLQLGDRLPNAAQATADSLGMTVGELNEMIGRGKVLAEDLLPHLASGLEKVYGTDQRMEGTISAWNKFKNALSETFVQIGQDGQVMNGMILVLELGTKGMRGFMSYLELMGRVWGTTFGMIASFDWKNPIASIRRWREACVEALNDVAEKYAKGDKELSLFAEKQVVLSKEAAAAAKEQALAALTVERAYTTVTTAAEQATLQAEKARAAREEEGKAALSLVNALGSEADKRTVALQVAQQNEKSLRDVAAAREQEAAVARAYAATLAELAGKEGQVSEAKRKAIQEAQQKATVLQSEAEKAAAAALASQQHAAALEVEAAALQDNSAKVYELQAAYQRAQESLVAIQQARAQGKASLAEEQAAMIAAAQAGALYRDSLADVTAKIQAKAKEQQAANSLAQAETGLALQQVQQAIQLAQAKGDEAEVIRLKNEASQLEIQLARLKAEALEAEARAQLELIKAKREELEASGQLTPVKAAELKVQEASAKVKQVEAEAARQAARHISDMREATEASAGAAARGEGGYRGMAAALDGIAASASAAASAVERLGEGVERTNTGYSKGGWKTDASGNMIRNQQYGSFSDWSDKDLADLLSGKRDADPLFDQLQKMRTPEAMKAAREEMERRRGKSGGSSGNSERSSGASQGSVHKVVLTLPSNKTQEFNMASAEDAAGLSSFLAQLGDARSRS